MDVVGDFSCDFFLEMKCDVGFMIFYWCVDVGWGRLIDIIIDI